MHEIEPTGILKKYIKNYHIVETNSLTQYLTKQRVFPYGNVTIVFHYGSPSKFQKKNSKEYTEPTLVICGQQTSYYDLALSGKTGMILIVFKPYGIKPFFNIPINELLDENIALQDLMKHEARILENKLLYCKNNLQRIHLIENFFLEKLTIDDNFNRIEHAIKIIEATKGQIKTQLLAQETCLGIKQFERIFSKNVGINPKKFISITRFQNIIQMKKRFRSANLFSLAFEHGYHDQSHFIHDFKNITGLTPGVFFNDRK